ncbi:MAG: DUF2911 domain-containing protein [Candidatus Kapaibacterium sp.]|nr:MAG: DUF2911 domain-containing protein [Candidatus Kapabacteria bacterium]
MKSPAFIKRVQGFALVCVAIFVGTSSIDALAQGVRFPAASPAASLKQTVGITDISVVYSRPGVKGRDIWGKVVAYNELWRSGANLSTMLEVSDDVKIEGQKVPAGKYSIFLIPVQQGDWTLVVNKAVNLAGTSGYKQEEDVFRAKVKPVAQATSTEWLEYTINDLTDSSATLALAWEKVRIPIKIEIATSELAFSKARTAIAASQSTNSGFVSYALQTNSNLEEAMKVVDASIAIQENYRNQVLKARLLEKMSKKADAIKLLEKAITLGKAAKNPPFDLAENEKILAAWKSGK